MGKGKKAKETNGTTENQKSFCTGNYQKNEKAAYQMIENITNDISGKALISRVYKELIQVNIKKWTNKPEKNGQRT